MSQVSNPTLIPPNSLISCVLQDFLPSGALPYPKSSLLGLDSTFSNQIIPLIPLINPLSPQSNPQKSNIIGIISRSLFIQTVLSQIQKRKQRKKEIYLTIRLMNQWTTEVATTNLWNWHRKGLYTSDNWAALYYWDYQPSFSVFHCFIVLGKVK